MNVAFMQSLIILTLTRERSQYGESITVRLVSSFASLDSTASLHAYNNIFSFLVKFSLANLETSRTVIIPHMVSVLCLNYTYQVTSHHAF